MDNFPASIATLAQRQPLRWANVGTPTLIFQVAQRWRANVGPTLCQHRPNIGTLTLGQRWHYVTPMVVCQRGTNIDPTVKSMLGQRWYAKVGQTSVCQHWPNVSVPKLIQNQYPALSRCN